MALPAHALITLNELKEHLPAGGTAKDAEFERYIGRASSDIEGEGVRYRRLVYRGPVEGYQTIVSGQAIGNGALTIAGAPDASGRTLIVRKTDPDRGISGGILTVSQAAPVLSETFDLSSGD